MKTIKKITLMFWGAMLSVLIYQIFDGIGENHPAYIWSLKDAFEGVFICLCLILWGVFIRDIWDN